MILKTFLGLAKFVLVAEIISIAYFCAERHGLLWPISMFQN